MNTDDELDEFGRRKTHNLTTLKRNAIHFDDLVFNIVLRAVRKDLRLEELQGLHF